MKKKRKFKVKQHFTRIHIIHTFDLSSTLKKSVIFNNIQTNKYIYVPIKLIFFFAKFEIFHSLTACITLRLRLYIYYTSIYAFSVV